MKYLLTLILCLIYTLSFAQVVAKEHIVVEDQILIRCANEPVEVKVEGLRQQDAIFNFCWQKINTDSQLCDTFLEYSTLSANSVIGAKMGCYRIIAGIGYLEDNVVSEWVYTEVNMCVEVVDCGFEVISTPNIFTISGQ